MTVDPETRFAVSVVRQRRAPQVILGSFPTVAAAIEVAAADLSGVLAQGGPAEGAAQAFVRDKASGHVVFEAYALSGAD